MADLAIYVHYPFCKSKCPYCDFNSHLVPEITPNLKQAYQQELAYYFSLTGKRKVSSIFFGGGTPSLMADELLEDILANIHKLYEVREDAEITLEANPTSYTATKLKSFKSIGIKRLSLGIQALNDTDLKFLGREHNAIEALNTIKSAAEIFENFSFDLIYARPQQTVKKWRDELSKALDLGTKHLSLYQLTIEKGTPFYSKFKQGEFTLPSEAVQEELYDVTNDLAANYGLARYEVSNYAKPGFESQHNLHYWHYRDYIGIGAGAHSRFRKKSEQLKSQLMNYHLPEKWQKLIAEQGRAVQTDQLLSKEQMMEEQLMMNLRTIYGINLQRFKADFNEDFTELFADKLAELQRNNLIKINKGHIVATWQGFKLLNSIQSYLLGD